MKKKFIDLYMDWAVRCAKLSHGKRLQVGAVIVKDDSVISYGYNGMPAGWDNNCEYVGESGQLVTRPEVLHAEMNSLMKLAKSSSSGDQSSIFVTHSPCLDCAKGIYQAGISQVYFKEEYRDDSGIKFLQSSGVTVYKYNDAI